MCGTSCRADTSPRWIRRPDSGSPPVRRRPRRCTKKRRPNDRRRKFESACRSSRMPPWRRPGRDTREATPRWVRPGLLRCRHSRRARWRPRARRRRRARPCPSRPRRSRPRPFRRRRSHQRPFRRRRRHRRQPRSRLGPRAPSDGCAPPSGAQVADSTHESQAAHRPELHERRWVPQAPHARTSRSPAMHSTGELPPQDETPATSNVDSSAARMTSSRFIAPKGPPSRGRRRRPLGTTSCRPGWAQRRWGEA